MSLGSEVTAALPLMRSHALSLMSETFSVDRKTSVWDEVQQRTVTTWAPVVESSPCYLSDGDGTVRVLVTDELSTPNSPSIHAPYDLVGVEPDDRVTHSSGAVMWVTDVPLDPYPVESIIRCRRVE